MKSKFISLLTAASLLSWSFAGQAHSSLEAMQNGGTLAKLSAALLHPLLESGYLPALGLLSLLLVLLMARRQRQAKVRRLNPDNSRQVG